VHYDKPRAPDHWHAWRCHGKYHAGYEAAYFRRIKESNKIPSSRKPQEVGAMVDGKGRQKK